MEEIEETSTIKATLTATPDDPHEDFNEWIRYIYSLLRDKKS